MSAYFGRMTAEPVGLAPRIAGRLINGAIVVAIYLTLLLPLGERVATGYIPQPTLPAVLIAVVLSLAVGAFDIYLILVRSTTLGPWLLGQCWIQAPTGEAGRLQYLLKLVVQSLFEGATFGIGTISLLVTYREGQHWLDRAFGVVAVARASVRETQAGVVAPGPQVTAVIPVAMPAPQAPPAAPPAPPLAPQSPAPAASPFAPPNPWAPPDGQAPAATAFPAAPPGPLPATPPSPFAPPAAQPVTPRSHASPPAPPSAAPAPSFLDDRTVVEPEEDRTPVVVLDDGQEIRVDGPVVLGRNPVPPAAYPHARQIQVADASMRMSKTHLVLLPAGAGIGFVDVGATNGVALAHADDFAKVAPQRVHELPVGAVLHFGGRSLRVRQ